MALLASCSCGKSFQAKPELAGKTVKCPSCGSAMKIPAAQAAATNAAGAKKPATAAAAPAAASIRVACTCGKAFAAKAELAGKRVKCPGCGEAIAIPANGNGAKPTAAVKRPPAMPAGLDPLASDPFGSNPLGGGGLDLSGFDEKAFAAAPAAAMPASPLMASGGMAGGKVRPARSGGSNKGLIIGLVIGGVALVGVMLIVVVAALLIPAVKAAREAARRAQAARETNMAAAGQVPANVPGTTPNMPTITVNPSAPPADTWVTHEATADGYSILLPKTPMQQTQFAMGATVTMAVCDLGPTGAYMVAASRIPLLAPGQTIDANPLLDGAVNGAVANVGGKLINQKTISLDGNPGREIDFEGSRGGQTFTARARIYIANGKIYQMLFLGPSSNQPTADIQKCFDSFKLTAPPPAATPATPPEIAAPPGGVPPGAFPPGTVPPDAAIPTTPPTTN